MQAGAENPLRYLALAVLRRAQLDYASVRTGTQHIPYNSGGYADKHWLTRFMRGDSVSSQLLRAGYVEDFEGCKWIDECDELNDRWFTYLCEVAEVDRVVMMRAIVMGCVVK